MEAGRIAGGRAGAHGADQGLCKEWCGMFLVNSASSLCELVAGLSASLRLLKQLPNSHAWWSHSVSCPCKLWLVPCLRITA